MGRGVSTPTDAIATVFLHREFEEQYEWDEFLDDLRSIVREKYPSFQDYDRWIGREDHAILENGHACITVSSYCGVVAICLVPAEYPQTDTPELARAWCEQVEASWEAYVESRYHDETMTPIGTASNGETFYQKAEVAR